MDAGVQGAGNATLGGLEELMDEYLRSQGFYRKKIAKDGSCLFRAVAEQVLRCQSRHTEVRATCVQYLKSNRSKYESFIEGDFDEYLRRLEDPQNWVGEVEISALALIYKHDFIIFQEPGKPPVNITENSFSDKVRLCFLNGNHYDSVYPREFINTAALCQSILYELLYEKVCRVDRSVVANCVEASSKADEEVAAEYGSSDESDLEEEKTFWPKEVDVSTTMNNLRSSNSNPPYKTSGKLQPSVLSPRVQMSLNPFTFRNVEYDVWLRSKRAQQKRDFCIAAGMQYVAGDKCKVRLDKTGQMYSAYVQEVSPNNGPVTVFIEELGQKHSVSLWNLRPPVDDLHAWNTVAEKGKRQALANGIANSSRSGSEWESRGKKASAKVQSPTTQNAPRVAHNRMQKQNSWSLQAQAFTEEQTLSRGTHSTARRNDTGAPGTSPQETRFGLSSEERLAREEEQKSQALREILYKDEKSFPALGSMPQPATQTSESGRRVSGQSSESSRKAGAMPGEKRGSKKKGDLQERPDGERKTHSPKTGAKREKNKASATSQLESPVRMLTDQACPSPSEQLLGSSLPTSALAQPSSVGGHALEPSAGPTQPTHVLGPPTLSSSPVTQAATSPTYASTQSTQGHRPPNANPARPVQTAGSSMSGLVEPAQAPGSSTSGPVQPAQAPGSSASGSAQPAQAPGSSASGPAQPAQAPGSSASGPAKPTQDLHPPASVSTLPKQTPGLPTCSPSLLLQGQGLPAYTPQPSQNPPQYSVIPPASTPTPQSFQSHVVPTPAPQTGPSVLTSFSSPSLPADTPPYEATSAMPQMRISPVPATVPLMSNHQSHSHTSTCPPHGSVGQSSMPLHQFPYPYQDPLYPGFPLNDKEEAVFVPQFSLMRSGEDLPRDMSVLRFFFNLGIKAYTCPMWAPYSYIYPLQQTYWNAYTMQPKVPSGAPCVPPWVSDAPTSTPLLHVNSIPSSTMTVPENYSQVVLGTAGGRAMGQIEHPGMGLALGSEGRPALGYSLQSPMQLQPHTGSMPWPRPGTFTGTISSAAPPPPPVQLPPQFLPTAPYPPMLPGYSALKLPAGADHTNVAEIGKTMGRPGTDSPAHGVPVPLTEAELSAEGRVSAAASPAQAFVPAERVVLPRESKTAASSSETTTEKSIEEVTLTNTRVCTPHEGEHGRSDVDLQGAGGVAGGTESILPLTYRAVPQEGAHQSYGAPREHCDEEGEANEGAFRGTRHYYSGPYRGRRSFEDGRGWRGSSRGVSRARRDYSYRERRSVEAYPGSFDKGQSGRGRGRAYSQYRSSREVSYT